MAPPRYIPLSFIRRSGEGHNIGDGSVFVLMMLVVITDDLFFEISDWRADVAAD